ncbi:class I SAM-dependent methyltransferase [Natronosalvus vescus]|uniref:class I SAM-dependent methyltransferase n=1 Tax=Natronosalvus vescus TaxID=2953881 RepID=UPI002091609E|nr:class I SAM-dependent methyltransferase [Natronosalvus vescus]
MDADTYFDQIASVYDATYDGATGGDLPFYRDLALEAEAEGPVLEVGCGTGRIYLELLETGIDADGIDVSSGMLEVLREKAAERGLEPSVREANVTMFDPERSYALVIVPFRAFLHLLETDEQLAALDRIYEALAPDGRLVLNIFTPNFAVICERYGTWEEIEVTVDGDHYTHRRKTELTDEVDQLVTIRSEIRTEDGELLEASETDIALVSKRECDLLFRLSPFEEWGVNGGFDGDPLESSSQEMVWMARRRA